MEKSTHPYTLSPGNITSCWRGVFYEKKHFEKPPICEDITKTLNFFKTLGEKGSAFQKFLTADWRKRSVLIEPESWLPDNQWNIRGKFDAICDIEGKPVVVEIKGAGDSFFEWYKNHQQPLPSHKTQVLTYYLILRDKYPDLKPKILYVNRKTQKCCAIDVEFTEEQLQSLIQKFEQLHILLETDTLPPVATNIEPNFVSGIPDISMTALTCRYHCLCNQDNDWYQKSKQQIQPQVEAIDFA